MITGIEAVNGAASAFTFPAMAGIVPLIVDRTRLQPANALLAFSRSGLTVIGPAVAGLLVVTVGPGWALAFDALTYLVAIVCLWQVRLPRATRPAPERTSMLRRAARRLGGVHVADLAVGRGRRLRAAQRDPLRCARRARAARLEPRPALGESGWGLALSAEAVGTVVATVVMLRSRVRHPLRAGMIAIAAIAVPMVMLGVAVDVALVFAMFVAGCGRRGVQRRLGTAMQEHMPEAVLSRVSSYDALGSFVAMPLGIVAVRRRSPTVDPETLLVVSGGLYAVLALGRCGLAGRSGAWRTTWTTTAPGLSARRTRARRIPVRNPGPVSIKDIRLFGDPVLRTPAVEVVDFDKRAAPARRRT